LIILIAHSTQDNGPQIYTPVIKAYLKDQGQAIYDIEMKSEKTGSIYSLSGGRWFELSCARFALRSFSVGGLFIYIQFCDHKTDQVEKRWILKYSASEKE